MKETNNSLNLPSSVSAYMTDVATQAGVDALTAVEPDALPPELEWHELGDFLAAKAAAELVKSEYAMSVHRLWQAVWEDQIPTSVWGVPALDEIDDGRCVTPEQCWEEQSFFLYHTLDDFALYTLVSLDRRQATIAFSLERKDRVLIKGGVEEFTWRDDDDWPGWMKWSRSVRVEDGSVELSSIIEAAKTAMLEVSSRITPPSRRTASKGR